MSMPIKVMTLPGNTTWSIGKCKINANDLTIMNINYIALRPLLNKNKAIDITKNINMESFKLRELLKNVSVNSVYGIYLCM